MELSGLIDQEWSHAAGQVCKIIVSDNIFFTVLLLVFAVLLSNIRLRTYTSFSHCVICTF